VSGTDIFTIIVKEDQVCLSRIDGVLSGVDRQKFSQGVRVVLTKGQDGTEPFAASSVLISSVKLAIQRYQLESLPYVSRVPWSPHKHFAVSIIAGVVTGVREHSPRFAQLLVFEPVIQSPMVVDAVSCSGGYNVSLLTSIINEVGSNRCLIDTVLLYQR